MSEVPAILGGKRIFSQEIQIVKPSFSDICDENLMGTIRKILESNTVTRGPYQAALEEEIAKYLGVKHIVAVSNCTLALALAIQASSLRGKEIAVPSFTISATVNAALWNNCKPLFVDIDSETFNMSAEDLEKKISKKTSAIMPVHVFGNPNNEKELRKIADENNSVLVFDAAQAFGSAFGGKKIGGMGLWEALSGSPTKHFSTAEGGFVATNDRKIADTVRLTRNYGVEPNYNTVVAGLCARMPEINAAIGLAMLPNIEAYIKNRNNYAEKIKKRLGKLPGLSFQKITESGHSSYNYFGMVIDSKEFGLGNRQLQDALLAEGIHTKIYYHPPVHLHTAYKKYNSLKLPVTEDICERIICLPFYNNMSAELIDGICIAVENIQKRGDSVKKALK
ncbi:MAG TPA: DegT/DnrJ/EryC1/StrS family aminotransferase [archaeon]|nr:DegT/DnrJ/EryC1/StrS family aminotransferase [archaeon]